MYKSSLYRHLFLKDKQFVASLIVYHFIYGSCIFYISFLTGKQNFVLYLFKKLSINEYKTERKAR